ncbi:class I SAM-dependent methyltransferase [Lachnoanaerobaculum sp. Marseille-Q4761]|jgi:methyltransferase type 11|uniref:class I SAM-dependent DNA methyltransferase n=1 Tax=Lachnoanaerobaculum sp. Marseille-Q4761 TaxID=2819511 RepID=UPI000F12E587|nr:class I SAM-dependent methyltransferase [Lachnoanaerobaculum sp. Marseille-Q4761]MBO1871786.1 class I SAM-dependent methyltransferase [Lachnoanaerobaculum sp. Marseille-Q4761]RKW37030.1 MAG: class I SAM-dependent methyltransferase [Lachnospiraceae bacterium]
MEQYTNFAKVYDLFMDNVPYDKWVERIRDILHKENIFDGLICDLGCGTGAITERLANIGYDMIGIDNSYDMLDIAMEKKYASGNDILYLCQDMREFELYGTVRAIVSGCDSLNYIQDLSGLEEVFSLVNNYLDPGGLFIFDMNTVYKYQNILGENTFSEVRDQAAFIWENTYDNNKRINEYDLNLFIKLENDIYKRFEERHVQRAYTFDEIVSAINSSNMQLEKYLDADTYGDLRENTERILFIAREKGK